LIVLPEGAVAVKVMSSVLLVKSPVAVGPTSVTVGTGCGVGVGDGEGESELLGKGTGVLSALGLGEAAVVFTGVLAWVVGRNCVQPINARVQRITGKEWRPFTAYFSFDGRLIYLSPIRRSDQQPVCLAIAHPARTERATLAVAYVWGYLSAAARTSLWAMNGAAMITVLKCKIHRATVTDADLHYPGSITVDRDLMDAAGLYPYEMVHVVDINNGERFVTYVIEGPRGGGAICLNGAAARLVHKGDLVILMAYQQVEESRMKGYLPRVIVVDESNRPLADAPLDSLT
jgi:aspartate 1-decarboxylase